MTVRTHGRGRDPGWPGLLLLLAAGAGCSNYQVIHHKEPAAPAWAEMEVDLPEPETRLTPATPPVVRNPEYPEVVTAAGDTLGGLAQRYLGRRLLWRHLMEWNKLGYGPEDPIAPGTTVVIPLAFRSLAGAQAAAAAPVPEPVRAAPLRVKRAFRRPETVFRPGEQLTFDVRWFAITAGQGILTIAPMEPIDGVPCWHFVARAMSRMIFFFKVDDRIESHSTVEELLPVRFEKHVHEGRYHKDQSGWFDRTRMVAKWGNEPEAPLDHDCRDLLGAFYFFRTVDLPPPGTDATVCVHTGGKNYQMVINVLRRETIRVPAGEFRTVVIKPRMKFEGLFRQQGDVTIWLTDDASRTPVLVQSKVFLLGSVNIVLTKLERP